MLTTTAACPMSARGARAREPGQTWGGGGSSFTETLQIKRQRTGERRKNKTKEGKDEGKKPSKQRE